MFLTSKLCQAADWSRARVAVVSPASANAVLIEFHVAVVSAHEAVTRRASIVTGLSGATVCEPSNQVCNCADVIWVPDGISDSGNLTSERTLPAAVVPTANCHRSSRLSVGKSSRISTSSDCHQSIGWILIVGSTTTGQRRSPAPSHAWSARTVTSIWSPCWATV